MDAAGNLVGSTNCSIKDEGRVVAALTEQANRIINNDTTGVFDGYTAIREFSDLDTNTIKAKNDITTTKSTEKYASQQADVKYSGGKGGK